MKKNILKIALFSSMVCLFQWQSVFAAIQPDEVVELVNRERLEARLPDLQRSPVLDLAAREKADDMATERYFSHTSPKGVTPWNWFRDVRYAYRYAGENLAIHFTDATLEHRAFMESVKHCENIMSPKYREIGVAVREMEWEGKTTTVAVQLFGTTMADEEKIDLNRKSAQSCPKSYPSVLGASMPSDRSGGAIGSLSSLLADTVSHFKIDTARLLTLLVFAMIQTAGIVAVLTLFYRERWIRRW